MVTLVACNWWTTPDVCQLFSHGPDVVRFKATAASDEPDSKLVSLASPPSRFPARDLSGFDTEGKLGDLNPTKAAPVRHHVTQGLCHQIRGQLECIQSNLHRLQHLQADERVKETVDSDKKRPSLGHSDGTLAHTNS